LPASLHAQRCWRRLTMTLTWFTPINPGRREYRSLAVKFQAPRANPLVATGVDVHGNAVSRGTVQHEVFEGDATAMDIGANGVIEIPVTCFEDAGLTEPLPEEGIPYALAVSVEVAPETALPIYEEILARVRTAVRLQP
jgi:hypothetical protein